jgi:hypothetical protein
VVVVSACMLEFGCPGKSSTSPNLVDTILILRGFNETQNSDDFHVTRTTQSSKLIKERKERQRRPPGRSACNNGPRRGSRNLVQAPSQWRRCHCLHGGYSVQPTACRRTRAQEDGQDHRCIRFAPIVALASFFSVTCPAIWTPTARPLQIEPDVSS